MNQDSFDPEVFSDFVIEAREHLETIEPNLLELEKEPENLELLDDIFRPMHSLKGASGFLGLNEINTLAHKGENVLDELRKGNLKVTSDIMDVILEATDALRTMIDTLESEGREGDLDVSPLVQKMKNILAGQKPEPAGSGDSSAREPQNGEAGPEPEFSEDDGADFEPYKLTLVSPEHLVDFMEEAKEVISDMNSQLMELEKDPSGNHELINDLFRNFHNIKGNSGIIGFKELNALTHAAETLLNKVRNGEIEATQTLVDTLLQAADWLEDSLGWVDMESVEVFPKDITDIQKRLEQVSRDEGGESEEPEQKSGEASAEPDSEDEALSLSEEIDNEDLQIFKETTAQQFDNIDYALKQLAVDAGQHEIVDGLYRAMVTLQNSAGYMGLEEIKTYAERTANLVDQSRNTDMDFSLVVDLLRQEASILKEMVDKSVLEMSAVGEDIQEDLKAEPQEKDKPEEAGDAFEGSATKSKSAEVPPAAKEELAATAREAQKKEPKKKVSSEEGQAAQKDAPAKAPAKNGNAGGKDGKGKSNIASTIRVEHSKLDHLMNLIGELIINRNRFSMLTKSLEEGEDVDEVAQNLMETTYSMARISDDLQATIMNVRMVPVQMVFSKFPRLIRDLSRKSAKNVELVMEGEETELDKSVVELIGDPLVHLLRNAVDHGLEGPEKRRDAGKAEKGTVWLRAAHKGNSVIIEVEDDGNGIDPEKMRKKGVEKGIISAEDAKNLDDQEAVDLIFAPGFSTAEEVTDISGRGVGMDVVRNNIKSLKGSINVDSRLGQGSKFSISLPLTLAIIDALMIKAAGETFAIPLDAVSQTTKISAEDLSEVNKRKAITLRGEVLGIVELTEILGLPGQETKRNVLPLVILNVAGRRLGIVVDDLLERQEIVIKSLGDYLGDLQGIAGATIMGNGHVVLILDPHEIYRLSTSRTVS